jgi:nitroimidazol reductase NimA-like FMN-containing flavoprotein (pyridoxamine 5'-phosphate oxidase superfamily)
MRIHTLTVEECVDFLRDRALGQLACSHQNQPYIVPIHFAFDPERRRVYAFSSVGQKIKWMRENPAVCLEIDDIRDKDHWTTVLVFGRYRELQRGPAHAEERHLAVQLLQKRPEWWLPAAGKVADYEHPDVVLYSIDAGRFSGRRVARPL